MTGLAALGLVVAGLVILAIGLAFVPIGFEFEARRRAGWTLSGRLWWGGLVKLNVGDRGKQRSEPTPRHERSKVRQQRESRNRRRAKRSSQAALAALRSPGFASSLARLVKRLLKLGQIDHLHLTCCLGLGDPASTGRLFAAAAPVVAMLNAANQSVVFIEPDFIVRRFDVDASARLRFVPGRYLVALVAFGLSPTTLRALGRSVSAGRG